MIPGGINATYIGPKPLFQGGLYQRWGGGGGLLNLLLHWVDKLTHICPLTILQYASSVFAPFASDTILHEIA